MMHLPRDLEQIHMDIASHLAELRQKLRKPRLNEPSTKTKKPKGLGGETQPPPGIQPEV